jgi:hypothetical protein
MIRVSHFAQYQLWCEGNHLGTYSSEEEAIKAAKDRFSPGDIEMQDPESEYI